MEVFFSEAAKYSMKTTNPNQEIVFIGPDLDLGDISKDLEDYDRQQSLNKLLSHQQSAEELEELVDSQKKEMNQLLRAAQAGKTIRIWKSDTAFSASAFAYVCYRLKDIEADIRVISLSHPLISKGETVVSYSHWGEVIFDEDSLYLVDEEKLTMIEKEYQAEGWKILKEENSFLRAVINGEVLSVPEDFYDHLLLKHLPDESFVLGELIAEVLSRYPLGVSDSWYHYRIQEMIQDKKLTRVGAEKKKSPYEQKLKKTRSSIF